MGSTRLGQSGGREEARGEVPLHGHRVASGVELGKPTHFTVNAKAAGKGKLDVQFSGLAKGDAVRDVDIIDHHDNTYTVKYTPVQQVLPRTPQLRLPRAWASSAGLGGLLWRASHLLLIPIWDRASMEWKAGGRGAKPVFLSPFSLCA